MLIIFSACRWISHRTNNEGRGSSTTVNDYRNTKESKRLVFLSCNFQLLLDFSSLKMLRRDLFDYHLCYISFREDHVMHGKHHRNHRRHHHHPHHRHRSRRLYIFLRYLLLSNLLRCMPSYYVFHTSVQWGYAQMKTCGLNASPQTHNIWGIGLFWILFV